MTSETPRNLVKFALGRVLSLMEKEEELDETYYYVSLRLKINHLRKLWYKFQKIQKEKLLSESEKEADETLYKSYIEAVNKAEVTFKANYDSLNETERKRYDALVTATKAGVSLRDRFFLSPEELLEKTNYLLSQKQQS